MGWGFERDTGDLYMMARKQQLYIERNTHTRTYARTDILAVRRTNGRKGGRAVGRQDGQKGKIEKQKERIAYSQTETDTKNT